MRLIRAFIRLVLRAGKIPPSAMQCRSFHWIVCVSAARLIGLVAIFALMAQPRIAAAAPAYEMNERIEVNILGSWDKAVIIGVGKAGGEHEGEFKVHYDGYPASYDRWLRPVYFRKVAGGAPAAPSAPGGTGNRAPSVAPAAPGGSTSAPAGVAAGAGPRLGKYNINSYGAIGRPPLYLGHIELQAGGKYRISRRSSGEYYGEGTYTFDATRGAVEWLSGPCKDAGWSGTFTIERDGRTHKIRLKSTTIATNSTD